MDNAPWLPLSRPGSGQVFGEEPARWEMRTVEGSGNEQAAPHLVLHAPPEERTALLGIGGMHYLGQIAETYLLLRAPEGLRIVDQHAAHERILYERLKAGSGSSAPLAVPLELALHPSQNAPLQRGWQQLHALGFVLETPAPGLVLIRAVPAMLSSGQAKELLLSTLDEKEADMERLWCLIACRTAVKAGEPLSESEALSLLALWLGCPERDHCPHGRPTAVTIGPKELERLFKRGR